MSNYPKGFFPIIFGEFVCKFSYWGVQSLLVLMLIKKYFLSQGSSFAIFGVVTSFTFLSSILGGILGDKIGDVKFSVYAGIVAAVLGNFCLTFNTLHATFFGFVLVPFGSGLISPNLNNILGRLYDNAPFSRQAGFTLMHGATNAGGLVAPLVYGAVFMWLGWRACFFFGLMFYLMYVPIFLRVSIENDSERDNAAHFYILLIVVIPFIYWYGIYHQALIPLLLAVLVLVLLATFLNVYKQVSSAVRKKLLLILLGGALCTVFYTVELQFNSSILLYFDRFFYHHFLGFYIPTNTIVAVEPLFVVLSTPLIAMIVPWKYLRRLFCNAYFKLALTFFLTAVGFLILMQSVPLPSLHKVSLSWILAAAFFIGFADALIVPTVFSQITEFVPIQYRGRMIGLLYLFYSLAGYGSGILASFTVAATLKKSALQYHQTYFGVFLFLMVLAILLFTLGAALGYISRRSLTGEERMHIPQF